jgi:hypothetical protein
MSKAIRAAKPWIPVRYDDALTGAIKALAAGNANEDQQKRALKWIVEQAAATYDMSYRPGEDGRRDTDFHEGRRFVGNQIVKQLKLTTAER